MENSQGVGLGTSSVAKGVRGRAGLGRHLVLQTVGALLLVLATHLLIPFAQPQGSDDSAYLLLARDLKFGGGELYLTQPGTSLHFPPGYPWLLSSFVDRENLGWAPMVQRTYYGLTLAIASIGATTMFGVRVGWLVFGLLALNPALVASSGMLSSEAPHVSLYLAGFLAWFWFIKTRKLGPLILCSLLLALSTYVRAYGLLLVAFLPLLIMFGVRDLPWRRRLGYVVVFLVTWSLVLAPWVTRNYLLFQHFIPMTTFGKTLYSGWFPPGIKQFGMMASDEVTREGEKIVDSFERDEFYKRVTVRKILDDPATALATSARKYFFFLMPFDWEFFGKYNDEGRLRPSLHFVYVFLFPFSFLYIWQNSKNPTFAVGLLSPILYGLLMTGLVYGIPRFRLCIEPFLTVFAATYLVNWVSGFPRVRLILIGGYFLACLSAAHVFAQFVQ